MSWKGELYSEVSMVETPSQEGEKRTWMGRWASGGDQEELDCVFHGERDLRYNMIGRKEVKREKNGDGGLGYV